MKIMVIEPGIFGGRCADCDGYIHAGELLAQDSDGDEYCSDCCKIFDSNHMAGVYVGAYE